MPNRVEATLLHNGSPVSGSNPLPSPEILSTTAAAAISATALSVAATAGKKCKVVGVSVFISVASPTSDITITIKDNTTLKWEGIIGAGAPRGEGIHIPLFGLTGTANTQMNMATSDGANGSKQSVTLLYELV